MSSITPPADDAGVQSLRQDNISNTDIKSVSRIAAKPAIHQSTATAEKSRTEKRKHIERRKNDRRGENKHRQQILLDTRSQHERRTDERRNIEKKHSPNKQGINVKV